MFRIVRRRISDGVRFCDSCAEVTTAAQRAERRYERGQASVRAWIVPR
ncbi:hypothetical protein [Phytohabitans rumicis]|nr:hypothetical protein [Phytohabitans rumicis]